MEKEQMLGHRKRLREKYLKNGYKNLENYEILELLLTYSIKRTDCKGISKNLLKKFKSISSIINSQINDLKDIDGIGTETALFLKLIGDIISNEQFKKIKKENLGTLKGKTDLMNYLRRDMGSLKNEEFKVIYLSSDNKIVCDEVLFKGTIDRSAIYPRKIIERAIENRAKGIIFAHNHPSGNLTPSKKDIELTSEMVELLGKIDVKLLDHIIVGEDDHYSFYENGLIEY